ncbi:glycosyltransferase family 4 protein, partial [bacterium]|nr:glycosyltransferase family 4 protein [bacterium]
MRILHIIDHLGVGGAQTFLLNLLAAWRREDRVDVVGLGQADDLVSRFHEKTSATVRVLGLGKHDPRSIRRVRDLVAETGCDLLHAHLAKSILSALRGQRRAGIPLILHEQSLSYGWPWIYRFGMRRWQGRAARVIGSSRSTVEHLGRVLGVPEEKLRVVYNMVDLDPFRAEARDPGLRAELGIAPDVPVLGFLGRLATVKGPAFLIRAVGRLREQFPGVVGVLVGDGPLRQELEREARELGLSNSVRIVGYQADVPRWLSLFDVAVVPSLSESFGISALEAMAMG